MSDRTRQNTVERKRRIRERRRILRNRKRRIEHRLRDIAWSPQDEPMLRARNIQYELSDRTRGLGVGGIGAMHLLARKTGLIEALNREVRLFKVHLPYQETDHILNIGYNILCGGTCLEDLERRRNDEVYLDALGAQRIPDPTTAGDFCRRFERADVESMMDAINETRLGVWRRQDAAFFEEAVIEMDGSIAATYGQCKAGMALSYDGQWGYHPLIVSLANTAEPLYLVNRSGNRPSHEDAWMYVDGAMELCRRAGFRRLLLRGDTDFSQTEHLDRWDAEGARFIFGINAMANLVQIADGLPKSAWKRLPHEDRHAVRTQPRRRPENVKQRLVVENEYDNIRLRSEQAAEFLYRPSKCRRDYRIMVVRKNLSVEKGERVLFDDVRYFFYITNDAKTDRAEIVHQAQGRCDQENLIEQLKNGVHALRMPTGDLLSPPAAEAYMVMASLAWTLKAWFALLLPDRGRWKEQYRGEKASVLGMEFKRFCQAFMQVPAQLVRTGRRIVFRLLSWNPWQDVFLRGVDVLRSMATPRYPLQCVEGAANVGALQTPLRC